MCGVTRASGVDPRRRRRSFFGRGFLRQPASEKRPVRSQVTNLITRFATKMSALRRPSRETPGKALRLPTTTFTSRRASRGGWSAFSIPRPRRRGHYAREMSGGDPFRGVPHRANRQFNRQSGGDRPRNDFDHASKWPTPTNWSTGNRENVRPKVPYREDAFGNDRSLPLMPRHDPTLTPETLLAALRDDGDLLRDLLARGASTECRTESGATPLICAASKGANHAVRVLLENDADALATDKIGANALTLAASRGLIDTGLLLIRSKRVTDSEGAIGALLKWPTIGGETPLMAAAKDGHHEFVTMLLKIIRGTECPLLPYDDGGDERRTITAMQLACRQGQLTCVKALVAGGAPIGERSGPRQMTPLMHAACQGQIEAVKFLLNPSQGLGQTFEQSGEGAHVCADVAAIDKHGLTALLHAACATGVGPVSVNPHENAYRCFLALAKVWPGGPDAAWKARDKKGRNPMMLAARFGNFSIFDLALQENGHQSLAELDANNESALFAAVKGGFVGNGQIAEIALRNYPMHHDLLDMMEIRNIDGLTPLLWCAAHGRTNAAKWCFENGADILKCDLKGRLPRQIAESRGHAHTAQVLSDLARNKWLKL